MAKPTTRNMYDAAAIFAARYADQGLISADEAARTIAAAGPIVATKVKMLRCSGLTHQEIADRFRAKLDAAPLVRRFAAELFLVMHAGLQVDQAEYMEALRQERSLVGPRAVER